MSQLRHGELGFWIWRFRRDKMRDASRSFDSGPGQRVVWFYHLIDCFTICFQTSKDYNQHKDSCQFIPSFFLSEMHWLANWFSRLRGFLEMMREEYGGVKGAWKP